jgi:hypothetical protein
MQTFSQKLCSIIGRRVFDLAIAFVLFVAGFTDLFFSGYPPAVVDYVNHFVLDLYGFFVLDLYGFLLMVGSTIFMASVVFEDRSWAVRSEKAGLTVLIGALSAFSILLLWGIIDLNQFSLIESLSWILLIDTAAIFRVMHLRKIQNVAECAING